MKKLSIAAVLFFVASLGVQAQTDPKVKVNVVLTPFQSIEIGGNPGSGNDGNPVTPGYDDEVTLTYTTADDYKNGVEKTVANQLKISSVGTGYKVNAHTYLHGKNTLSSTLTKLAGNGENEVADAAKQLLAVQIAGGAKRNFDQNMENVVASNGETSASSSVLNKSLDVTYFGLPLEGKTELLKKLMGASKAGDTPAKYTIDVVYTISTN